MTLLGVSGTPRSQVKLAPERLSISPRTLKAAIKKSDRGNDLNICAHNWKQSQNIGNEQNIFSQYRGRQIHGSTPSFRVLIIRPDHLVWRQHVPFFASTLISIPSGLKAEVWCPGNYNCDEQLTSWFYQHTAQITWGGMWEAEVLTGVKQREGRENKQLDPFQRWLPRGLR